MVKTKIAGLMMGASLLALSSNAYAYYDQHDYADPYFILPNQSAFFIPDNGDNKDTQKKFGSLEYYEANKVAAKRFVVPHAVLTNSGLFSNYYVPSGRLIVVDRTPYNQEWTADVKTGSSAKDESFKCQSSEGLNIQVEMGVAASVSEDNASKFLYRFGVNPPVGDPNDPKVIFTSVYYGKSLKEVMAGVGRGEIEALACSEISSHTLDADNAQMPDVLKAIQTKADAWFAQYGITLDYLGWAGTFTFDEAVQKAIDDKYEADKIASVIPTLQAQADIKVKEGLGKGLGEKGLPTTLTNVGTNWVDGLIGWLNKPSGTGPK